MLVELRRVMISSSLFCNHQVSVLDKVMDNTLDSSLCDLDAFRHVAYAHIRVTADKKKNMAVIRQEGPSRHGLSSSFHSDPNHGHCLRVS